MIVRKEPTIIVPGVNLLTLESIVRPYGSYDFSTGWRVETERILFELGYSVWGHGDERVRLDDVFPPCPLGEFGIASATPGMTASESTISTLADPDTEFTPITKDDIDFHSAEARTALYNTFQCAVGLHWFFGKVETFTGFGSFIDFNMKNSDLNRWGLWFKIGGSF